MANTLRIKRRASGGAGAPTTLSNAELAYNEVDDILYYGKGNSGGVATTIEAIGGNGHIVNRTTNQTIGGTKTFTNTISGSITGNAGTATTATTANSLTTARTISTTGDATWSVSFNGSANVSSALTLATVNGNTGSFGTSTSVPTITVDSKGRITAASNTSIAFPVTSVNSLTGAVNLRLDQLDLPTASVNASNQRIILVADPVGSQDAANKRYVDGLIQGLSIKEAVWAATTANISLSGNTQFIDDALADTGKRILVKNQTTASQNGIYVVSSGAWTRAADMDSADEFASSFVFVQTGTVNEDTGWVCTVDGSVTVGTTAIPWTQFSGGGSVVAGNGLTQSGNTINAVGTANRIVTLADSIDIASNYVGQTSITTLGTIATGTWNASTIAVNKGGTGATTLTGYVKGNGTSAFTASATIPSGDISGLGTMATQSSANVSITGGSITNLTTFDGITIDGGTF